MIYDRDLLVAVLIYHQRKDITSCTCGWAVLGASHPEHVADEYEKVLDQVDALFRDD